MKTFKWTVPEPKHPQFGEGDALELPHVRSRLRHPYWITSAAIFILALPMLYGQTGDGGHVLFLPLVFGPMLVSLLLGVAAASRRSLITLLISNIFYLGLLLGIYICAFHLHTGPLVGIAYLYSAVYSLPAMIPMWIAAMYMRRSKNPKSEQSVDGSPH